MPDQEIVRESCEVQKSGNLLANVMMRKASGNITKETESVAPPYIAGALRATVEQANVHECEIINSTLLFKWKMHVRGNLVDMRNHGRFHTHVLTYRGSEPHGKPSRCGVETTRRRRGSTAGPFTSPPKLRGDARSRSHKSNRKGAVPDT